MSSLAFNVISVLAAFSPPFLLGFAWYKLLRGHGSIALPRWRTVLAWVPVALSSGMLVAFVMAFLTDRCNADLGDWSCVTKWRNFASVMVKVSFLAVLLAFFGRKGTRIASALAALAIGYDCVLVDMMA